METKPNYYKLNVRGVEMDVIDIAVSACLSPPLVLALKYIIRANHRIEYPSSIEDMRKAIECITRCIELSDPNRRTYVESREE